MTVITGFVCMQCELHEAMTKALMMSWSERSEASMQAQKVLRQENAQLKQDLLAEKHARRTAEEGVSFRNYM